MTKEEIIRMAREAGVFEVSYPHPAGNMVEVERFAALIAAAEREACARVCEDTDIHCVEYQMVLHEDGAQTLRNAAAAIRARGQE